MDELRNIQKNFQDFLLHGHGEFEKQIINTDSSTTTNRLAIYGNAYRSRLIKALVNNYPILHVYLGAEIFEKIASDYIQQHPSEFYSIRWFGNQLTQFLNNHTEYKNFPYLSELAKFEWTQTLAFDAADSTLVNIEDITKIPAEYWADMRFEVHPSLHRITLSWNVIPIWQALYDKQLPDEPVKNSSETPWMVWRRDLINRFCSLSEDEAWAIDALLNQASFGEICEGLCQWIEEQDAGIHAAALLKEWTQSGILSKIILPNQG